MSIPIHYSSKTLLRQSKVVEAAIVPSQTSLDQSLAIVVEKEAGDLKDLQAPVVKVVTDLVEIGLKNLVEIKHLIKN